ncbi:MAG TPA: efflux RND transporter periplasmic adaptor subunit [Candidatus Paceibacterota bacterium]|nr:efflux RND transporter periplasmic adaptor subunit [Candidatus Paceibacterota bacterium]
MDIRRLLSNRYVLGAALVVIVGGAAWFYTAHRNSSFGATVTVHTADFTQGIEVSGTVQAAQNVDLGFAQSGRVSAVYAQVGDMVPEGAVLAEVDNGDLQATVAQKEAALEAAQATLASLQAGTRPETIAITETQIQNDQVALAQNRQSVINAIKNAYTESDDAVHNKADQLFSNPYGSTPTLDFTTSDSQLQAKLVNDRVAIESVLSGWETDVAQLSTSTADLSAAQDEAQANLALVSNLLSDANAVLNLAIPSQQASQTTVSDYVSSISTARTNVNAAQSTLTTAVTTEQGTEAALAADQKNLALQQAGSTQEDIDAQKAQVAAAQAAVTSAQAQLQQTIVTAPFSGVVTRMDAKVGQVVSPSTPEISMISSGLFQIVTYVPEVEVAGLSVGNEATTTLDAYGADTYFAAKVISIDPAETVVNGVSTYKTTLQFLAPDPRIRSGMTADVHITTMDVSNAIAVPQGAIFEKNGQEMVQVAQGRTAVDVPVTTGGQSLGNVQITSGLTSGDVVILSPDTSL